MSKIYLLIIHTCLIILLTVCTRETKNLEWHNQDTYRWTSVEPGYFGKAGFEKKESDYTGIEFAHHVTQQEIFSNRFRLEGTGVATSDVDGDGLTDIYFTQSNGPNKLYKNLGGFRFEDITEQAGVAHAGNYSTGTLFADVNGDGSPDLLVATLDGENAVYINNGEGQFDLKKDSGLKPGRGSRTMTMADIDGDGDLDLFVANYNKIRVYDMFAKEEFVPKNLVRRIDNNKDPRKMRFEFKKPFNQYYQFIYRENENPATVEIGETNHLYLNDGTGRFTDVIDHRFISQSGNTVEPRREWSLTARFQDINGDRLPDLYICNDFYPPDRVWINQGDGQFREMESYRIRKFSYSAMGVDISDINRDGHADFFVTDMLSPDYKRRTIQYTPNEIRPGRVNDSYYQPQYMYNSMYLNRGDNTFQEIAYYGGVQASGWSWATRFLDINLDGYEDLLINTGYPYDAMDMDFLRKKGEYQAVNLERKAPSLSLQNQIFRNNGDLTFSNKSQEWGFTELDVSYGLATADFDNDGDLDLVTSRFRDEAAIFENRSTAPRIGVRLRGLPPNTQSIGAKVIVDGGTVSQSKDVVAGGDYLSGSDPQQMFAANPGNLNHRITVKWPSGMTTIIDSVAANRIYAIKEPKGNTFISPRDSESGKENPVFTDLSANIAHRHQNDFFNDFQRQPLLPFKLSGEGPGIAWVDYDGDGDDDLFIGGNSSDKINVYENRGNEQFSKIELAGKEALSPGIATSLVGWPTARHSNIVVGNSDYQLAQDQGKVPAGHHFLVGHDRTWKSQNIPGINASTGPMAAADYDGDGDIDLFVGGRVIPGMYPLDAGSKLYKNEYGSFSEDTTNGRMLDQIGLATGAVFSDYDNDSDPDLVISMEWGAVKLFENQNGRFREITGDAGLSQYKGRWSSVTTGDFNNDGLIDLVATNLGKNSLYQFQSDRPLKMYYNDFNNDGIMDIIEANYDTSMGGYVPMRKLYEYSMFSSIVSNPVNSYKQYATQLLQELLSTPLSQIPSKQINTLEHTLFLNTGGTFEAQSLPEITQFSTANGAIVADYNNDGNEDLFLSQNFFDVPEGFPRQDAGRGMLLKGDGNGGFEPVPGMESGIKVYGQQQGAAFSDFNMDGKVDLAVTQRDSTTKLFLNNTDSKGIRVELKGLNENRAGIGTALQVEYDDGTLGPRREVQAGGGHYSMNSLVVVLGVNPKSTPVQLLVDWYDEKKTSIPLESNKWNYNVSHPEYLSEGKYLENSNKSHSGTMYNIANN